MIIPVTGTRASQRPAAVNDVLTSWLTTACYYARTRPDCQMRAAVRYGPIALCASCDQRRSSVGKGITPVRLSGPQDLLEIAAARDARQQADAALHGAVTRARQAGQPWSAIAATLGVSRQAAQQRFASPPAGPGGTS